MKGEFTPGPWRVADLKADGKYPCIVVCVSASEEASEPAEPILAKMQNFCEGTGAELPAAANAKLIARTPDLLAALDLIADVTQSNIPPSHRLETIQTLARTAIAQATQQEEAA